MKNWNKRSRWLVSGGLGAVLLGAGFSIGVEASHWKHSGEAFWFWAGSGVVGIALLLGGVVVLIRTGFMEQELKKEKASKTKK